MIPFIPNFPVNKTKWIVVTIVQMKESIRIPHSPLVVDIGK